MTPARYSSSRRMLRGIEILEARHKEILLNLNVRRQILQNDIAQLARLIGDLGYADARLLQSMSRRVGTTSTSLKQIQQRLDEALLKEHKLSKAKQLLHDRIEEHTKKQESEELGMLVEEMISARLSVQPSTRKRT